MKIGILTLPFNNNYGGYLQAYALMETLKQMGHEPTIINRRSNHKLPLIGRLKYFVKGMILSIVKQQRKPLIWNVESEFFRTGEKMISFFNTYITPQMRFLYTTEALRKECEGKFDAYIVGSDQVWRAIYVPDISNYYLDFTADWNVKRIAYAASFGTDKPEYTDKEKIVCGNLIQKFDAVSVRESSGKNIISDFGWKTNSVEVVLDPTMLLGANHYDKLIANRQSDAKDKIFSYILDFNQTKQAIVDCISHSLKKEIVGILSLRNRWKTNPSVEEWLLNIRNSDFVITDSFHGTIFSIIFHKEFVVIPNKARGTDRFTSILSMLGLEDRMINSTVQVNVLLRKPIDWNQVEMKLNELRAKSIAFLSNNLK